MLFGCSWTGECWNWTTSRDISAIMLYTSAEVLDSNFLPKWKIAFNIIWWLPHLSPPNWMRFWRDEVSLQGLVSLVITTSSPPMIASIKLGKDLAAEAISIWCMAVTPPTRPLCCNGHIKLNTISFDERSILWMQVMIAWVGIGISFYRFNHAELHKQLTPRKISSIVWFPNQRHGCGTLPTLVTWNQRGCHSHKHNYLPWHIWAKTEKSGGTENGYVRTKIVNKKSSSAG